MAKFPITYSTRLPQPVQQPIGDVGGGLVGRALSQAGEALTGFGQQMDAAEAAVERAQLQRQVEERRQAAYQAAQDEPDREKRLEIFNVANKDITGFTSASKRRSVNQAMQIYIDNTSPQWDRYYNDLDRNLRVRSERAKLDTLGTEALAKGDVAGYVSYLQTGLEAGLYAKEEYDHRVKFAEQDAILAQADIESYQNPMRSLERLSDETFRDSLDADRLRQAEKIAGVARRQFPDVSAEYNKQLTDLMVQGQLTVEQVQQRRDFISDKDYQAWTKIAMNPADKPGNVILTAELKSAASDIWRGALTRTEFDERVRDALASPTGINDVQYADIVGNADRELKSTQAEDIRRFSRDAAGVILGEFMGVMSFDALGVMTVNLAGLSGNDIEIVKQRMHFLSLYEQGLRDYIAENPRISGRELYQFASEQKMRYWNTTIEQVKAIAKQQGRGGVGIDISLPTPQTQAEFDSLPSGTVFIAPDGTRRRKP